jgi:hypothetical protein
MARSCRRRSRWRWAKVSSESSSMSSASLADQPSSHLRAVLAHSVVRSTASISVKPAEANSRP